MSWKRLFLLAAFLVIFMVSFRLIVQHFDPVSAVEIGMSPSGVTHVMGAPQNMTQKGTFALYTYPKAQIYFLNGKVVAIVTDVRQHS